jgi:hypothetical protein
MVRGGDEAGGEGGAEFVVFGLFEEEEEVLAGDGFEDQKEEGGCLEGAMECDDVGVDGKTLVNTSLE